MSKNITMQEVMEILQDVLGKNFNFDQVGDIKTAAKLITNKLVPNLGFHFQNRWDIECIGPDGNVKWTDYILNMVVDEGLADVLDVYFDSGTQDTTWFVGLTDATPSFANGDTMVAPGTWTEEAGYTGTRPAFDLSSNGVTGSGGSVSLSNSNNVAVFAITGTATIGGAFLTADTSGTAGVLYGGDAFTGGNKSVGNGDTLNVTVTVNAATA